MVTSTFLAVALSESLGPVTVALGVVGLSASWFCEPPRFRPERWVLMWNLASLAVMGYTCWSVLVGDSLVISFSRFLLFLLVAKMSARVALREYLWAYVLSFTLLVAGAVLNGELNYGICFLAFTVFATWALILFHLRREIEQNFLVKHSGDSVSEKVEANRILASKRIVGGQFLLGSSAISLAIFIGSSVLFLLFPRIGFGLFIEKSRSGMSMAGFSDDITLGGHGRIRDDSTVVMRVVLSDPRFGGNGAPALHWRGVGFDHYERGQWSRSHASSSLRPFAERLPRTTRIHVPELGHDLEHREIHERLKLGLEQSIYLEPLDTAALFAASAPLVFEVENEIVGDRIRHGQLGPNGEIFVPHVAGFKYVVYSEPDMPDETALAAAPDGVPTDMAKFLEIPKEMPPRVIALARQITAEASGPYAKALAVREYLSRYGYTLRLDAAPDREPIDYFLFDRKEGHCEYFSSAMAILLRAVGVPTRNVNGFLGGEWNEFGNYIAVRGGDAHSWIEVWFAGVGWVMFDPTPPGRLARKEGENAALASLRRMLDSLRLRWFKWVVEYDLKRQVGFMRDVAKTLQVRSVANSVKNLGSYLRGKGPTIGLWALWALGVVVFLVLLKLSGRVLLGSTRSQKREEAHPVVGLYLHVAKQYANRGYGRKSSQTPLEHAFALEKDNIPGAEPFVELTELYYAARYGRSKTVDLARATKWAEEVRAAWREKP